jgi:hypothetical protein
MRRLARHAFTALSALSLLLCVAVCVLWVRSLKGEDRAQHLRVEGTLAHLVAVTSTQGRIELFACTSYPELFDSEPRGFSIRLMTPRDPTLETQSRLGFAWDRQQYETMKYTLASVSHVLPAVITMTVGIAPFIARHRRRVRTRLGLCAACGYDLRASRERCPECGTPAKPAT